MEKIFNVLDYGAVADAIALDSSAVQKTIDACSLSGGGTDQEHIKRFL